MSLSRSRYVIVVALGLIVGLLLWLSSTGARAGNDPAKWVDALGPQETCVQAYQHLQENNDPAVYPALVKGLAHPERRVRVLCLSLLADADDPGVSAAVRPLLDAPEWFVRREAAATMVRLADPAMLLAEVRRPDCPFGRRQALVTALAPLGLDGFHETLLGWATDRRQDVTLRLVAVRLLAEGACATGEDSRRECRARAEALRARDLAVLERLATDPGEPRVLRASAVASLGLVGRGKAVPTLLALLNGSDEPGWLKEAALVGLGRTGDAGAWSTLLRIFRDANQPTSFRVRALEGAHCLGEDCKPLKGKVLEHLYAALQDDNKEVRRVGMGLLPAGSSPMVLELLKQAAARETDECLERDMRDKIECESQAGT